MLKTTKEKVVESNGEEEEKQVISYSIEEMMAFAKENKFPKSNVQFGNKIHSCTTILHFFNHIDVNIISYIIMC